MPESKASAEWRGGLKSGSGTFDSSSGFRGEYTFASRFEGKGGATPEELIAAALASCYSMALSAALEKEGHRPESTKTEAICVLEMVDGAPRITGVKLETHARIPDLDENDFQRAAKGAKENCPVSKALAGNVSIELDATLE